MTFRIAQISDTHLGREKSYFTANFHKVAAHIAAARFNLVLNSGDMSLDGAGCEDDLLEARRLHETLRVPVRFIPGNHVLAKARTRRSTPGCRRSRRLAASATSPASATTTGRWRLRLAHPRDQRATARQRSCRGRRPASVRAGEGGGLARNASGPVRPQAAVRCIGGRGGGERPLRQSDAATPAARSARDCTPALIASGHVHQYRSTQPTQSHHVWAPSTGFVLPDDRQPRYGLKQTGYVEHALHSDGTHASTFATVPGLDTLSITDFPEAYRQSACTRVWHRARSWACAKYSRHALVA